MISTASSAGYLFLELSSCRGWILPGPGKTVQIPKDGQRNKIYRIYSTNYSLYSVRWNIYSTQWHSYIDDVLILGISNDLDIEKEHRED